MHKEVCIGMLAVILVYLGNMEHCDSASLCVNLGNFGVILQRAKGALCIYYNAVADIISAIAM